jgi:hypothetical protein
VIFDFEAPSDRDLIETVALLAGLSCFVIADFTKPRSTPLEVMLITPHVRVPFASIIESTEAPFTMLRSLQAKYEWMLPTFSYRNESDLVRRLKTAVVDRCTEMRKKLSLKWAARNRKAKRKV